MPIIGKKFIGFTAAVPPHPHFGTEPSKANASPLQSLIETETLILTQNRNKA